MALALVSAGLSIYSGIEQAKAGRAAKKQAHEIADEERLQAVEEGKMAGEAMHDLLVEGQHEVGALRAFGGKSGVGGTSFGTMESRIKARTRRKMFLLNKRTSESMRRSFFSAEEYESQGRRALKTGRQASYMSFMKAGTTLYGAGWGSGKGTTSSGMITAGGRSAGGGNPYFL